MKERVFLLRSVQYLLAIGLTSVFISGCAIDRLLTTSEPPEGSAIDPSAIRTREGAVRVHAAAIHSLTKAFAEVAYNTAVFTDELSSGSPQTMAVDSRISAGSQIMDGHVNRMAYNNLHAARINAAQAATVFQRYGSKNDSVLIGESFAIQAQTIVYLAEMYCSGIPLTNVPYDGGLEYTAGKSTVELFETAVELYDSAITYARDSIRISSMAKIGKGRALIGLGKYSEAKDAVLDVDISYRYSLHYTNANGGVNFWSTFGGNQYQNWIEVVNKEGGNGLDWISAMPSDQDPRVPVSATPPYKQQKLTGFVFSIGIAKGIEARMIEAEALMNTPNLPAGDWIAPINAARTTVGLSDLSDPVSPEARINLLFKERAFWFYFEGHRLADFRRLVRQYNRPATSVYANGAYPKGTALYPAYDPNYVFSPPKDEMDRNHTYDGCIHLNP